MDLDDHPFLMGVAEHEGYDISLIYDNVQGKNDELIIFLGFLCK